MHRSGKEGILTTLTNACTLLALNASCLGFYKDHNQIELAYVFESAYFLLIFSFHLFDKLRRENHNPYLPQFGLSAILTSTLQSWLEKVVEYIRFCVGGLRPYNTVLLPKFKSLSNALQYVIFLTQKQLLHNITPHF